MFLMMLGYWLLETQNYQTSVETTAGKIKRPRVRFMQNIHDVFGHKLEVGDLVLCPSSNVFTVKRIYKITKHRYGYPYSLGVEWFSDDKKEKRYTKTVYPHNVIKLSVVRADNIMLRNEREYRVMQESIARLYGSL